MPAESFIKISLVFLHSYTFKALTWSMGVNFVNEIFIIKIETNIFIPNALWIFPSYSFRKSFNILSSVPSFLRVFAAWFMKCSPSRVRIKQHCGLATTWSWLVVNLTSAFQIFIALIGLIRVLWSLWITIGVLPFFTFLFSSAEEARECSNVFKHFFLLCLGYFIIIFLIGTSSIYSSYEITLK